MRVDPTTAGVVLGERRRTPGLRREEVAALSNVSQSWYTNLERGRQNNASVEVLDSVAAALRLSVTERRYLRELGQRGGYARPGDTTALDANLVERLVRHTESADRPAYAINESGDVLSRNRHVPEWYGTSFGESAPRANLLWWMFTSPDARTRMAEWETEARAMTARARFAAGAGRVNGRFGPMVDELLEVSTEFAAWWELHDVDDQVDWFRSFTRPDGETTTLQLLAVRPAAVPHALVMLHLAPEGQRAERAQAPPPN